MDKEKADYITSNAFNGIEYVNADFTKQTFSKHVHEGYTIGVIEQGAQRFFRSGANHIAGQDSIILVNADDVHTGESATTEGWRYKAIYPTPDHFEKISQDLLGSASLTPYFRDSVINDKKISSQLRLIFDQIENGASTLLIETLIYSTLLSLSSTYGKSVSLPKDSQTNRSKLSLAKAYLDEYPEHDVSLERLAQLAGCTKFHFVRQFGKTYGISPHAYQVQVRLIKAKQLLKAGSSVVDTAIDCGFHDQSHFSRHFKRALGTTPKQFQQAILYNH
ncbi:transcriptional regulator, AraC/XylSfamily [Photobacterium leiognathi lrivu.4.1]|uniref:Transcriptional regulator, AraC/XylSfamily n=1 Tax=Photobacterium leiognathi lrivu.4.1 TaxID=1248232 RepID=X0NYM9_PHOLE|nr:MULTISPECIES: AraC family transcriptional regulator [Photobacterium]GAD29424.1 transcriptional regulator, AraC/XylSfamily [Photobacterium leiognathi lrivu.4.1]